MRLTRAVRPDGQTRDRIADADRAGEDLTRVAAEFLVRAHDELDRQPERLGDDLVIDLHRLEILEQARAVEPGRPVAPA